MKHIEIWADSFHEGEWCCDNICTVLSDYGYSYVSDIINGFIPHYVIAKNGYNVLEFVVYGSYKSWNPTPFQIKELISWGKPDCIVYDAENDKIMLAVEETAATPTGNQAMQRCERQYGSAHLKVPYWYLVSEYGTHEDGGVRRDNIWPSIAAIKLSIFNKVPCIVVHYSDIDNVEDYHAGKGWELLFRTLSKIIENYILDKDEFYDMDSIIAKQYNEMLQFVLSQWQNVIDFLPSKKLLQQDETADFISDYALDRSIENDGDFKSEILVWPLTKDVPKEVLEKQQAKRLIKYDVLAAKLEADISKNKCYVLSNNAGSGKPTKREQVQEWINEQKALSSDGFQLDPPAIFNMKIEDFPETKNGNIHVTTSKHTVYLYDYWKDLKEVIESSYPRLRGKLNEIPDEKPVFLYVSNSIKPGRLFGDPFTGQLSGFATCFGKFDTHERAVIVYFPHQVYTQVFNKKGEIEKNKGINLYKELTDYIIFNAGVVVSLKNNEVI